MSPSRGSSERRPPVASRLRRRAALSSWACSWRLSSRPRSSPRWPCSSTRSWAGARPLPSHGSWPRGAWDWCCSAWRALVQPAIAVAVVLWAFTNAFVLIQARLVGSLELFSGFAFVLATMIWLSIGFQVLLLGAAWTHVREPDAVQARDLPVQAMDPSTPGPEDSPPAVARPRSSPD